MRLRIRSPLVAPCAALALAACGNNTLAPEDIVGTHALVSVDGRSLPTVVDSTADAVTRATSGSLALEPDGRYTLSVQLEASTAGSGGGGLLNSQFSDVGEYRLAGRTLELIAGPTEGWIGDVSGSRITVAVRVVRDTVALAFQR